MVGCYSSPKGASRMSQRSVLCFILTNLTASTLSIFSAQATSSNEWAWMKGSTNDDRWGIYGTQGVPGPTNNPGGRESMVSWKAADGTFWVFGGYGYGPSVGAGKGDLNDLWKFDPVTTNWTWIKGPAGINQQGFYGIRGVAGPNNTPGGRYEAVSWSAADGTFWLFGGYGYGYTNSTEGYLNDVWKFDPVTTNWT
jgi:hypothetical protein